jgi:hypothetical protein
MTDQRSHYEGKFARESLVPLPYIRWLSHGRALGFLFFLEMVIDNRARDSIIGLKLDERCEKRPKR